MCQGSASGDRIPILVDTALEKAEVWHLASSLEKEAQLRLE
jgi:hypothetical protein